MKTEKFHSRFTRNQITSEPQNTNTELYGKLPRFDEVTANIKQEYKGDTRAQQRHSQRKKINHDELAETEEIRSSTKDFRWSPSVVDLSPLPHSSPLSTNTMAPKLPADLTRTISFPVYCGYQTDLVPRICLPFEFMLKGL